MRHTLLAGGVLLALLAGCDTGRKASRGFWLPDGDIERGQAAFVDLRCHGCHRVAGLDLPPPVAEPPVPVVIGRLVSQPRTDGELVAAIISPSHGLAPGYERAAITSGRLSRMPDYSQVMTVRQLIDLVAFLHSRHPVVPPPQTWAP